MKPPARKLPVTPAAGPGQKAVCSFCGKAPNDHKKPCPKGHLMLVRTGPKPAPEPEPKKVEPVTKVDGKKAKVA